MKKKKKSPAQEYLEKIRKLDVQIDCMLTEKEQLKDMALRITPAMSASGGSSGGGNQDKLGGAVSRIVDKEKEIDQAVDTLICLKQEASSLLSRLDDPAHMKVLHERYIQYKSFESIAAQMSYTYRGICYLHGRALQAFGKVLEEHRGRITINVDGPSMMGAVIMALEDRKRRIQRAEHIKV
ncbi:MAG: hypothetical protein IJV91_10290 [Kiritimatiellae bacterium]|nr:hypothetical protein [Kiritimatiellia bacterium]